MKDVEAVHPAAYGPHSLTVPDVVPAERPAVLMVDDQPARLLSYEAILSGLQLRCVRALSGSQALERLLTERFAVVLLDVSMPGMDGFEVAQLIRSHPRFEDTPIIFITGVHISELDQLKGYQSGAIDYIAVPIVPEILRSKVAVLVELYQRRSELQAANHALAQAREQLRADHARVMAATEAQLRGIFENPAQITTVMEARRDDSGRLGPWVYRNANSSALKLFGHTRETLLGRELGEVLGDPELAERAARHYRQCLEERRLVQYESPHKGRDYLVTAFPLDEQSIIIQALDISERRATERALSEADRRKDEFLAMLAHELRNPVAPIRNATEVLMRQLADDEKKCALVRVVDRQTLQLSRLLDDLLDVARITQGRIQLKPDVIALASCVELAVEMVQPLISERAHRLTIIAAPGPLYVSADKVRLVQCISNLLTNAAKYTQPGGQITLRTQERAARAIIEVTDNGAGLSAELLPHIFELFVQSERTLDRSQGGLGVGLSICRQLVEMHGGDIFATSPGPGSGSTFTIQLPSVQPPRSAGSAHSAPAPGGRRVLVVDDNRDAANTLAMLLEMDGYQTRSCYTAEEALTELAAFAPEAVLLDIGLPRMDGYEVARRIRERWAVVRLAALSGYGQSEDRRRSQAAGFDGHFVKPVDLGALTRWLHGTGSPDS